MPLETGNSIPIQPISSENTQNDYTKQQRSSTMTFPSRRNQRKNASSKQCATPRERFVEAFWTAFQNWCRNNSENDFANQEPGRGGMERALVFCSTEDYDLLFYLHPAENTVGTEIYAKSRTEAVNVQTMNRLEAFRGKIEKSFEQGVDCRWNNQRNNAKARITRFLRRCVVNSPTAENFRLMVSDAKNLVRVLHTLGEPVRS